MTPWAMNPSCVPFSGEISGRTAVIIPTPMNDTEAIPSTSSAVAKFASGMCSPKKAATTPKTSEARTRP